MKFNGVSKKENGKYIKIDGAWYTMPENVRKFVLAQKYQDGEEINIKSHAEKIDGRDVNILDYIERVGGSPAPGPAQTQSKSYGQKSPEEREEIKRQAVMKAVCSAIPGLAGSQVDVNTLGDLITTLYDRALAKVNE